MDITYIPMARGFVYIAAVMDWFSRKVLAWRVSVAMDTAFCVEAVSEARARIGRYVEFYNARRPHSSLGRMTPDQSYDKPLPAPAAA